MKSSVSLFLSLACPFPEGHTVGGLLEQEEVCSMTGPGVVGTPGIEHLKVQRENRVRAGDFRKDWDTGIKMPVGEVRLCSSEGHGVRQ